MTTHTPGPWEVGYQGLSIYGPDRHGTTLVIARSLDTSRQHCDPQEAQANARLIAAAPELLDVAKDVLAECMDTYYDPRDMGGDWLRLCDRLRAAIAKATGQE